MAKTRVALGANIDRAVFDRIAHEQGWRLANVAPAKGGEPRKVAFVTPGATSVIVFADDGASSYAEISAHDPSPLAAIIEREVSRMETVRAMVPRRDKPRRELPQRPRLSRRVHARLTRDGDRDRVLLHDLRAGLVIEIDLPSWRALELADGTRDVDAICVALAREDLYQNEEDLVGLLAQLHEAGVIVDGIEAPTAAAPIAPARARADRSLEVLEGFTLACDGRGGCCRTYDTVAFTRTEAMTAEVLSEQLSLPLRHDFLFTPMSGAQLEAGPRAVALRDGRCAFLEHDGACGIHRVAGALAKPRACSVYPTSLTDDGVAIRVSVAPECACVLASVGRSDGAPLVPPSVRSLSDLGLKARMATVSDPVPLTSARSAPREALREWSARLVSALADREVDAPSLAWRLSEVALSGLDLDALDAAIAEHASPSPEAVAPWLAAFRARFAPIAEMQLTWRSANDLNRGAVEWMQRTLDGLDAQKLLALAPAGGAEERFYLRALAHGHRLAVDGRPLVSGLCDRALRLWLARAMAIADPPADPAARYPLALLEASMRNLGLVGYADALSP